jgi:hypothetical protein
MIDRIAQAVRQRRHPSPARQAEDAEDGVAEHNRAIVERAMPFTMTSELRIEATVEAVRHCIRREIPGAFAECGVWRGGSVLAMILTLQELGVTDRDIYLYDTFEGMTEPGEHDGSALAAYEVARSRGERPWEDVFGPQAFNEEGVRQTLAATGYPEERLHFVRGAVEETIPASLPERLALLRLDTDWYESTRHELTHLYPVLSAGGVLIIDDYGHWDGCRRAVDEYFGEVAAPLLLARIDYTGRIAVKC